MLDHGSGISGTIQGSEGSGINPSCPVCSMLQGKSTGRRFDDPPMLISRVWSSSRATTTILLQHHMGSRQRCFIKFAEDWKCDIKPEKHRDGGSRFGAPDKGIFNCYGMVHRGNVEVECGIQEGGAKGELKAQSQRLASAARATFGKAILLDPWIVIFCTRAVHECGTFVQESRPEPAILTSASHKATVRKIAYLVLLNYSLLVAAQQRSDCNGCGILDTGVVKLLPLVGWDVDNNQKLALVSFCDASDLDGTDPVLWLNLACAACKLSILSGDKSERYKRLERHALEMEKTAMPSMLPPNRSSIVRALRKHPHSLPDVYNDDVACCKPWAANQLGARYSSVFVVHFGLPIRKA